jgi:Ribbon-helix-helix protein, copG family
LLTERRLHRFAFPKPPANCTWEKEIPVRDNVTPGTGLPALYPNRRDKGNVFLQDVHVAEVHLLLPSDQAAALEHLAERQGLTAAQLIRRLITGHLVRRGRLGRNHD